MNWSVGKLSYCCILRNTMLLIFQFQRYEVVGPICETADFLGHGTCKCGIYRISVII